MTPIFIPFSKLNGKICLTHNLQNFTGKFHITLEGVLICSAEYNGLEADLEQAFDHIQLCETDRQLLRGVMLESVLVNVVDISDEEAAAVATATAAAAAAYGFDGNEDAVREEGSSGDDDDNNDDDDDIDGDNGNGDDEEEEDEDEDTVTDLPSSKLQFDSDDDSYDEDQQFSQQASFYG
jgi:hypothetical protein